MAKAAIQPEVKKTRKVAPTPVVDTKPARVRVVKETPAAQSVYEIMFDIATKNDKKFGGRNPQEKEQVFLRRFVESLSEEISDAAYKTLPEPGAEWLSEAVVAINNKQAVPFPPGYVSAGGDAPTATVNRTRKVATPVEEEVAEEEVDEDEGATDEEEVDDEEETVEEVTSVKAKANGKAAPSAKKTAKVAKVVKTAKVSTKVDKADKETSAALGGVELIRRFTIENEGCSNEDVQSYLVKMGLPNVAPATISVTKGGTLATMAWLRKLGKLD